MATRQLSKLVTRSAGQTHMLTTSALRRLAVSPIHNTAVTNSKLVHGATSIQNRVRDLLLRFSPFQSNTKTSSLLGEHQQTALDNLSVQSKSEAGKSSSEVLEDTANATDTKQEPENKASTQSSSADELEGGRIYSLPWSPLMMARRFAFLSGTAYFAANTCFSVPNWHTYTSLEYGSLLIPLVGLVYLTRQDYLYNKLKAIQIDYDAKKEEYTLKNFAFIRPKKTVFGADAVTAPPDPIEAMKNEMEKNDAKRDQNQLLESAKAAIYQPESPQLFTIKGELGQKFDILRKYTDLEHPASEVFHKKAEANKENDSTVLGKIKWFQSGSVPKIA